MPVANPGLSHRILLIPYEVTNEHGTTRMPPQAQTVGPDDQFVFQFTNNNWHWPERYTQPLWICIPSWVGLTFQGVKSYLFQCDYNILRTYTKGAYYERYRDIDHALEIEVRSFEDYLILRGKVGVLLQAALEQHND